jgi:hypothetical protein
MAGCVKIALCGIVASLARYAFLAHEQATFRHTPGCLEPSFDVQQHPFALGL